MLPTLFISHGSPMTAIMESPARSFLQTLATHFPRPTAILVASAHWETAAPQITAVPRNTTIHDFGGFPKPLYQLQYNAPGAPELATTIVSLLQQAGFSATIDPTRGLDHGAWVPLLLAYPEANIPVLQLSIQSHLGPAHHLALGAALRTLPGQNILIIGSGSFTHDLRRARHGLPALNAPETPDITTFSNWMNTQILTANLEALTHYRTLAPHAADQHPTEEHLLPLYIALGAAPDPPTATRLHTSTEFSFLRMDTYAFR